jgi:integrase
LFERFWASADFCRLATKTRADYQDKARVFLDSGFAERHVRAVTKPVMYGFWEEVYAARGHSMANGVLAVVRRVFSYGELIGWLPGNSNPALRLGRPLVEARVVVWTPAEIARLVELADATGVPSVGDAVVIALHTGQRQGDVLRLELTGADSGYARFHVRKTGTRVSVPFTPQLEARLAAIRSRRAVVPVPNLYTLNMVVLSERTGQEYDSNSFGKAFRPLRATAAKEFPGLERKWFADLRDTAITRLALAGCTVPQIRAITGHSLDTVHSVLKHYLALDERSAEAGIDRLKAWMVKEGIAV